MEKAVTRYRRNYKQIDSRGLMKNLPIPKLRPRYPQTVDGIGQRWLPVDEFVLVGDEIGGGTYPNFHPLLYPQ